MPDDVIDEKEFTDEQLRATLRCVGMGAREKAFAAGLPVHFLKGEAIIALFPDGTEKIVKVLSREPEKNGKE